MKSKDAINLFLKKEFSELRGRRNFNLWVLTGVFFVSILVIGFGSASMSYLGYKMDDPFINWVDIILDQRTGQKMGDEAFEKMDPQLYPQDTTIQRQFRFIDPQSNYIASYYFWKRDLSAKTQREGRSIAAEGLDDEGKRGPNPILVKIFEDKNVVVKRALPFSDRDLGVVITDEMARSLGYDETPAFVAMGCSQDTLLAPFLGFSGGKKGFYPVYLPVVAVVKQLPGMMDFLFTGQWYRQYYSGFDILREENNEKLLLCGEKDYLETLQAKARNEGFQTSIDPYNDSWKTQLSVLKISCNEYGDERTRMYNELMESLEPDMSQCTRIYEFHSPLSEGGNPELSSIRMKSLDNIRAFSEDFYDRCGIKLEMTNVEAKENFNFVQRMGMVLSGSVIVIVALFILVFIYFMLQSHFQKIQRNLGTFKAFGVDNNTLDRIYVRLILRIVGIAFAIGVVMAALVAWIFSLVSVIEAGFKWVNVFTWWNLLLLVLAVIAAIVATILVSSRMLKKTPGDLIYDRV